MNWRDSEQWNGWVSVPDPIRCSIAWAWLWSRPCEKVDVIIRNVWVTQGFPGGIYHFVEDQEPVWMTHLLKRAYPDARYSDLYRVIGWFVGVKPKTVQRSRELGRGNTPRLREIEPRIRELLRPGGLVEQSEIPPAWTERDLFEMKGNTSKQGMKGVEFTLSHDLRIRRWIEPTPSGKGCRAYRFSIAGLVGHPYLAEKGPMLHGVCLEMAWDWGVWEPPTLAPHTPVDTGN